ncbi:centromere-associated protein E isoform X2 [Cyprinodon tularosa]|uniref:centromere-associated protein E isoform X2 n=1 Tax=Cyprinodon tularosa TaxID=77115 RepID=UPI0018E2182C|nr:centromere-associated protein E isoform X2 [Cyprinodon tularosa]
MAAESVKVCVRVRPVVEREETAASENGQPVQLFWKTDKKSVCQIDDGNSSKCFSFDRVFTAKESTSQLYQEIAKPLVVSTVQGYNGTIFAYGQTSSGKTFTMMGCDSNPGVIPLAVDDVFQTIKNFPKKEFLLRVSYMEIYNETVTDLLVDSRKRKPLEVRETINKTIYVADLTEELVTTSKQALAWIKKGEKNRHYGKTKMNQRSSRSHTIFRMILESRERSDPASGENADGAIIVSHLNLVDLAGSERASQTETEGTRFKEGCNINLSLFTLGQVIKKLTDESQKGFTNYRDSKLTRILQNSLGGNAKTVIISTITPVCLDETLSTLQFASTAKKMKNDPHVTEVSDDGALLKRYRNEIVDLKRRLHEVSSVTQTTATEKEVLSQLLQEKEQLQREQEDRIRNLTELLVTGSKLVYLPKLPKRRMTWGGKMLKLANPSACDDDEDDDGPSHMNMSLSRKRKADRLSSLNQSSDEDFFSHSEIPEEPSEEMEMSQSSVTVRSSGGSDRFPQSSDQTCQLSAKISNLELQLEIESQQREEAVRKAEMMEGREAELQLQTQSEALQKQQAVEKMQATELRLSEVESLLQNEVREKQEALEKMQTLEQQFEELKTQLQSETEQKMDALWKLEASEQNVAELKKALETEAEKKLETSVNMDSSGSDLSSEQQTSELQQMRKDFAESLQLCESLALEKEKVIAERDYLKKELGMFLEHTESLEKEKSALCQELKEKKEMDEFLSLEDKFTKEHENELKKEISALKREIESYEHRCLDLQVTLTATKERLEAKVNDLHVELEKERSRDAKIDNSLSEEPSDAVDDGNLAALHDATVPTRILESVELDRSVSSLKTELAVSQEAEETLQDSVQTLKAQLESLTQQMAELTEQLQAVRKERDDLQSGKAQTEQEAEQLRDLLQALKTENVEIQAELGSRAQKEKELSQRCSDVTQLLNTLQAEQKESQSERSRLLASLEEKDSELKEMVAALQCAAAEKEALLQAQSAGAEVTVKDDDDEAAAVLLRSVQEELREQKQMNDDLMQTSVQKEAEMLRLSQELQAEREQRAAYQGAVTQSSSEEVQRLLAEVASLTAERDQLKEDLQENVEMMIENQEQLRTVLEKNRELVKEIKRLQSERISKQEELPSDMGSQLEELQRNIKSVTEELQSVREEKDRVLSEKESHCQKLQLEVMAFREEGKQLHEELREENKKLHTELEELKEENTKLPTELEELREENRKLHTELEELKEENTKLPTELEELREENRKLHTELEELKEENTKLPTELEELREKNTKLPTELEELREKNRKLHTELEELKEENTKLPTELEELREEKTKLHTELEELKEENRKLHTKQEENMKLHTEPEELKEENQKLHTELEELKEERMKLHTELEELKEENQKLHTELEDTIQMASVSNEELVLTRAERDRLLSVSAGHQSFTEERGALQSRLAALTEERDQLQEIVEGLREEKKELRAQLEEKIEMMQCDFQQQQLFSGADPLKDQQIQQLEVAEEESNQIRSLLQVKEELILKKQEEVNMLRRSSQLMEEEMMDLKSQMLELKSSRDMEKQELECLKVERERLVAEMAAVTEQQETLKGRLTALSQDRDQLEGLLSESQERGAQLQRRTEALEAEIGELNRSVLTVTEQKRQLEEELQHLLEKASSTEELLKAARDDLVEQMNLNSELKNTSEEKICSLDQKIMDLAQQLEIIEAQRNSLESEKEITLQKHKEEVEKLQSSLAAVRQEGEQLQDVLLELREEKEQLGAKLQENIHMMSAVQEKLTQQELLTAQKQTEKDQQEARFQQQLQSLQKELQEQQEGKAEASQQGSIGTFTETCLKYDSEGLVEVLRSHCSLQSYLNNVSKSALDSYGDVCLLGCQTSHSFITIMELLRAHVSGYVSVLGAVVDKDLDIFEERRIHDLLLSKVHNPRNSDNYEEFHPLWNQRLAELLERHQLYKQKMASISEALWAKLTSFLSVLSAETQERIRFNEALQAAVTPPVLSELERVLIQEAERRRSSHQNVKMLLQSISDEQNQNLTELKQLDAERDVQLREEGERNSALLKELHQTNTRSLITQLSTALPEQVGKLEEESNTKPRNTESNQKQAIQLLQTELQDTRAALLEKENTILKLKDKLQESEKKASPSAAELENLRSKLFDMELKMASATEEHQQELQKMQVVLKVKEESLRKLKQDLRSQQQGDESFLTGKELHARLTNPRGTMIHSSILLEKTKLEEDVKRLQLRIPELESLVCSLQAETNKWKNRAISLKGKSKAEPDKQPSTCTPKKRDLPTTTDSALVFSSPKKSCLPAKKFLDLPLKAVGSPGKAPLLPSNVLLDSPKSSFFDGSGTTELLSKTCPKQFFDNSDLGIQPDAGAETDSWRYKLKEEDYCGVQ